MAAPFGLPSQRAMGFWLEPNQAIKKPSPSSQWVNSSALFNFRSVPFQFNSIEERNGTGTGKERDWNWNGTATEREWSGNGMERNGNGTDMEQKLNGWSMNAQFKVPGLL